MDVPKCFDVSTAERLAHSLVSYKRRITHDKVTLRPLRLPRIDIPHFLHAGGFIGDFFAGYRIPGRHIADKLARRIGIVPVIDEVGAHVDGQVVGCRVGVGREILQALHGEIGALGSDVDQAGFRIPGVGMPAVTTLDALIDRYGVPRFCKVDVEGHEAEVLRGLSRPLDAVSVEFVAGGLDVAAACVERLEALGRYEYNAVAGEGRTFLFPTWRSAADARAWLEAGAHGHPSGDLYARRTASVDRDPGGME